MLRWLRRIARPFVPRGLSARLLVLTVSVVMLSEVLIFVPSIASYRNEILLQHLESAQIAALAMNNNVSDELADELLANAGVLSVILKRDEQRSLYLRPGQPPPRPMQTFDLTREGEFASIVDAFQLLTSTGDRIISVRGKPRFKGGVYIEAVMSEAPVRDAMFGYSHTIIESSILISVLTAAAVFAAINILLVHPMMGIERSMARFRAAPEDPSAIIVPSDRRDEIGSAERELAAMQGDLRLALAQRARLAALGTAVSKINHDLRNMLSSAQLLVDRLERSEDPLVQRLAPKLIAAIGRAVALCTNTLRYGRAEETAPQPRSFNLNKLVEDVGANAFLNEGGLASFRNQVPQSLMLVADPDQIFRVLLNLCRNAIQAIEVSNKPGEVAIDAYTLGRAIHIEVKDAGPGIPEAAQARLFEPFASVQRPGGSGLGLAIAAELVRAHRGDIKLVRTGPQGTVFRIELPQEKV
ncbi:MAG: HAMP domain-containing sensor histidine kinase [Alphaproteobacteria bacterium]